MDTPKVRLLAQFLYGVLAGGAAVYAALRTDMVVALLVAAGSVAAGALSLFAKPKSAGAEAA